MSARTTGGNKKSSKKDQPKRIRYNFKHPKPTKVRHKTPAAKKYLSKAYPGFKFIDIKCRQK
jgi:hypothetical protein